MSTERKTCDGGFTIIESIIVLSIIVIFVVVSAPLASEAFRNYRLRSAARELYGNMLRAKSEAVKRSTNVGIVFDTVFYPEKGGGYTVFLDDGSGGGTAGDAQRHDDEPILFEIQMPKYSTLHVADFGGNTTMGYNNRGLPLLNRTGSVRMSNHSTYVSTDDGGAYTGYYLVGLSSAGHPKILRNEPGTF